MSEFLPYVISIFVGIGLAAATGFRVFLPMFAVSLASYFHWIPANESFQWLASLPALITTGVATVVEILAYYIPYIDNIPQEGIERFQQQIEMVDLIDVEDDGQIAAKIKECIEKDPGAFEEEGFRV